MSDGTFVLELPLAISPGQDSELNRRFNAARQLYNACLGECLRRIGLIKQSRSLAKEGSLSGEAVDVVSDELRATESLLVCL